MFVLFVPKSVHLSTPNSHAPEPSSVHLSVPPDLAKTVKVKSDHSENLVEI